MKILISSKSFACLILIMISLFIFNCDNKKSSTSLDINKLSDINDRVIKEFFESFIDTLIGNCYLESKPLFNTSLVYSDYNKFTKADQDFFELQIENQAALLWEDNITRDYLLPDSVYKEIFNTELELSDSWKIYSDKYNKCLCAITIPLFTKDFHKVYIELWKRCSLYQGEGECIIFEYINDNWVLIDRFTTGIV